VAQFSASSVTGTAPLKVKFTDSSTGTISSRSWTFGDGGTSTEQNPSHTYTQPGLYTVALSVSGPGGGDKLTRSAYVRVEESEVVIEVGELQVNDQWQRVDFAVPFTDPIVLAQSLSFNGSDPAVVRVDGVDPEGFSIRVQEWDYLDGYHAEETVSYIVVERGYHQLPDGVWVEAGRLETNATNSFVSEPLSAPFAETPVVFAVVSSANEGDAVATRLRNITEKGFEIGMREQELNRQRHLSETIDYIAWEPSFGEVNGMRYEVDLMSTGVTHMPETLVYRSGFAAPPLFVADMQTTAGRDTANLRWNNRTEASVDVWVAEEQSKGDEMRHVAESVGYIVLDQVTAPVAEEQPEDSVCAKPCSLWDDATTPRLLADPDTNPVELGVKFRSDVEGLVTGILFYKSSQNRGTHKGSLWSSSGQLLAQATFTNETASGWQRVDFDTPVAIQADTVYVASYHTDVGKYSVDEGYFASPYSNGPLHLLADGERGGNGLYLYGAGGFPTNTYRASNYWVDVLFTTP
jgi:PKD repeat protein